MAIWDLDSLSSQLLPLPLIVVDDDDGGSDGSVKNYEWSMIE
jgi:hypothetical protein